MRKTILIVDDAPSNITMLISLLEGQYRTRVATTGKRALALARSDDPPDLILLDVVMPEMDGYEVCRALQAEPATAEIPILFLTTQTDVSDEVRGFQAGAVDYLYKPISPPILLARVKTHLALREARQLLGQQNQRLEERVEQRTRQISQLQEAIITALASLAETRDNETGNHIRRTQHYVRLLAERLREEPPYAELLDDETVELLFKSAPLHDIGKVGVPDSILLKPGKLTGEELEVMKGHTTLGRNALIKAEQSLDEPNDFLKMAREIAYCHHERWDGRGYPQGLSGENIPLAARMMAVADVYDALITERVYKPAFPHQKAVAIMAEGRGTQFDPAVLDAFLTCHEEFEELAARFSDRAVVS